MLEYDNDFHIMELTCDHCGRSDEANGTFDYCVNYFKSQGWRFYRDIKTFAHKCDLCVELENDD